MKKLEDLVQAAKFNELLGKRDKKMNPLLCTLAIIGAIAAVAGIAYAVYRYLTPDFLEDFDEDFEDDFEDDDDGFEEELEDK
ncbi:MAG: DUF4366 domain-containing protein [Lachnospiraceae bacterium]|jgi:hypothetical protein|nr:DUF4366 domain-containing protein [Lachnospiraceae bacterium]